MRNCVVSHIFGLIRHNEPATYRPNFSSKVEYSTHLNKNSRLPRLISRFSLPYVRDNEEARCRLTRLA